MPSFSKFCNESRTGQTVTDDRSKMELGSRCTFCTTKHRLLDFTSLQRGQHITLAGRYGSINIGDKLYSTYSHHAIVKSSTIINNRSAKVTLVHFYRSVYETSINIQETTELLDLYYHQIHVVKYLHPTNDPDTVIQRATSLVSQNKKPAYSVFLCNCEHFGHWCCIGNDTSFQVERLKENLKTVLSGANNVVGKLVKVISKLLTYSVDDIIKFADKSLVVVPWGVLSVTTFVVLFITIHRHLHLQDELQRGQICKRCCRRGQSDNWTRFATFCILQAGGLGLLSFLMTIAVSKGFVLGMLAVCTLLTITVTSLVPTVRRWFLSPFNGNLVRLKHISEIFVGDVISFNHWGLSHDGIVTSVSVDNSTDGTISVIHYSLPKLTGTRVVAEEDIQVDMNKDRVLGHDYTGYEVYPPQQVVWRASQRIGEQKFGIMSNRSCHLCHWAKVKEPNYISDVTTESSDALQLRFVRLAESSKILANTPSACCLNVDHRKNRKHATKDLGVTVAKIRQDITEGQIVWVKRKGSFIHAICIKVVYDENCQSKVTISVVYPLKSRIVCEDKFELDLRYDDIWIYRFHPINCCSKEIIVRRAKARIGLKCGPFRKTLDFAKDVVMSSQNTKVTEIEMVRPGDVISFHYWGFEHLAIVSDIRKSDAKPNNTGSFTIIHYALKGAIAKRTVAEETLVFDLDTDSVFLIDFTGHVTYPFEKVVERAKTRIGEQKHSFFWNTSRDLVYWAKVVQIPAIVAVEKVKTSKCGGTDSFLKDEILMLPEGEQKVNGFQVSKVHSWCDIKLGDIVEYKYYFIKHHGVVVGIDETKKTITVIHYGARHVLAPRTIIEETIKLDPKKETINVYNTDPRKLNTPKEIVQKAKDRLGEQNWKSGNRSWDFCLNCALKEERENLS